MPFSTIFLSILLGLILFCNNHTYGHEIEFPVNECASAVATQNYWLCASKLAFSIWQIHNWSEDTSIDICGIPCQGNLKGRISKFKWKWDGRFRCDTKAPGVIGRDTKKSRNGAMEWAIQDFINKAVSSGHMKPEDFKC